VLEERRQEKLKKAERMAGDLNNRAAEMEAQLEERVRKVFATPLTCSAKLPSSDTDSL